MLLFDLLANPPTNASTYRFETIALRAPCFEIKGIRTLPAPLLISCSLGVTNHWQNWHKVSSLIGVRCLT
ncbi:hypothetical protein [Trichothermofontia sp.]